MCILCGCDYSGTIEGIGVSKSFKLIKEHKNIEGVCNWIHTAGKVETHGIPDNFNFVKARKLFEFPVITEGFECRITWELPDEGQLRDFMITEKGFNSEKITKGIDRLKKIKAKPKQMRMDDFVQISPTKRLPIETKKTKKKAAPKKKGKWNSV